MKCFCGAFYKKRPPPQPSFFYKKRKPLLIFYSVLKLITSIAILAPRQKAYSKISFSLRSLSSSLQFSNFSKIFLSSSVNVRNNPSRCFEMYPSNSFSFCVGLKLPPQASIFPYHNSSIIFSKYPPPIFFIRNNYITI